MGGPLDQLARQAERSPALWATVVPALRQMIVSGALAPGQHLPEGELATALVAWVFGYIANVD